MSNQDFFRDIAMTKHPFQNTDQEVTPRELTTDLFQVTTKENKSGSLYQPEASFEERTIEFKRELEALRKKYIPFMENHLPKQKETVKTHIMKEFDFRYINEGERFTDRNQADVEWERVNVPDYRGPAEEKGKWRAYYRCEFNNKWKIEKDRRIILHFQCVDYQALVYINGNFVGEHEGFFAPFEFDITDYIDESNELIIECRNDYTILGTGPILDGDKIYAATGPGWDDPETGWHHCPAGAGVFGKVLLENRPEIHVEDIFVRPDIDADGVELRIGITNYSKKVAKDFDLEVSLFPKNLKGSEIGHLDTKISYVGIGKNEYRYRIKVSDYKLWDNENPYLYGAIISLNKENELVSGRTGTFGMKKFISDETTTPKGRFYFNNKPIVLRGANEMGHLQQCVMQKDFSQLIDDILIAKLCNMNYYRVTQRPVQEEIYDYFDMLGMMHQCDLPLFGFLRRPQFCEAIRQTAEMEHMIRRHVSTVMVTFINEPMCIRRTENPNDKFSKRYDAKGHRHLLRDELEAFFIAARKTIYVENPDRVIKNVEGDYDAPTAEGMPDFHTYTMWYTNHGEPIGKLMKGYMPPVKPGWMIGCGEYGAEGLDNENIIMDRYPKEWLKTDSEGNWYPDKIVKAQMHSVQGDWFEEQKTIKDWVKMSQIHQANATKFMTDAFRRRADVINQTAIHLLIDAWPSGWMKTLVCCDRMPKRAYFAFKDSLEPLRVNLYTDRRYVYSKDQIMVESWLLNDTPENKELKVVAELMDESGTTSYSSYEMIGFVGAADAVCNGLIPVTFPEVVIVSKLILTAVLQNQSGKEINRESIIFEVYPEYKEETKALQIFGEEAKNLEVFGEEAEKLCRMLGITSINNSERGNRNSKKNSGEKIDNLDNESMNSVDNKIYLSSDLSEQIMTEIDMQVRLGAKAVLLLPDAAMQCSIGDVTIETKSCQDIFFAASSEKYKSFLLTMLYNKKKEYIDFTGHYYIKTDTVGEDLVFTYDKQGFNGSNGAKPKLPFVKKINLGLGELTIMSLLLDGRINYNPNLDYFIRTLLV